MPLSIVDKLGQYEILAPIGATRVSTDGGAQPEWRRDGRELFYRAPDRKLMAVPVKGVANFDAGTPHALFELPPEPSADGQRFLIAVESSTGPRV